MFVQTRNVLIECAEQDTLKRNNSVNFQCTAHGITSEFDESIPFLNGATQQRKPKDRLKTAFSCFCRSPLSRVEQHKRLLCCVHTFDALLFASKHWLRELYKFQKLTIPCWRTRRANANEADIIHSAREWRKSLCSLLHLLRCRKASQFPIRNACSHWHLHFRNPGKAPSWRRRRQCRQWRNEYTKHLATNIHSSVGVWYAACNTRFSHTASKSLQAFAMH